MQKAYESFGISSVVYQRGEQVLKKLKDRFREIDEIAEYNQLKVLMAMQKNGVADYHLTGSTGYGHDDQGRDTLERVYADTFHTEDALVRPQITCGTHALYIALSANLKAGEELLSPVGRPYDTLEEVIGIRPSVGSLAENGILYREVDLKPDGGFDWDGIRAAVGDKTKLVTIQRSKGYSSRRTFSPAEIGELIRFIKGIRPDVNVMVDNCYGEFTRREEPSDYGADMIVGSLIKNPGGGLAPVGGYIAGRADLIERCAKRLTAPGLGKDVGASLGLNASMFQGFFLAPAVTAGAEKGALFAAALYESLGFQVHPSSGETRYDIIQAIELKTPENLSAFCAGIQSAAPVDSFVRPVASEMAGYPDPVIMAAGCFVQGSSIELSADGPMREPYNIYFQGGLTWQHAKIGILNSLQKLVDAGLRL
ncbi:MAG: methionine gamma-lyase family protein [Lachnospiraceae bacterium]|nr:methionine gamma-lyase family protein [Lachnospiraceae bacterium]